MDSVKCESFNLNAPLILDSLNDGVYVVDRDRTIIYWGKSAERITGWRAEEVVGKHCHDNFLCHLDKDGHHLCGQEHCPLHRAMVTGQGNTTPIIVFAHTKDGRCIPTVVSVAPIKDAEGKIIGGVETFRDLSTQFYDIERARKIQHLSLQNELPEDKRINFTTHYVPQDMIGGDYYAVAMLDPNHYGFLLADITGHGVAAALYTMYLSSLWEDNRHLILSPCIFAEVVNKKLFNLIKDGAPFAASICGVFDLEQGKLRLSGAGNPPPLLIHRKGEFQYLDCCGLPLGCMADAIYDEMEINLEHGDCFLFFTDGVIEVKVPNCGYLGFAGLEALLKNLGYPDSKAQFNEIEKELLKYSEQIRFDDDLTFLEARLA